MDESIVVVKHSGLHTAWLLATLGNRIHGRKSFKKEVLQISIPNVCHALEKTDDSNIRYSSNILYGISLMYKSKVSYFLSDVSIIKARLSRDIFMKTTEHSDINIITKGKLETSKEQLYLHDDPAFNIFTDLVPPMEENDANDCKRRKLEIQRFDYDLFPNTINGTTLFENSGETQDIGHFQTIESFINQDPQYSLSSGSIESQRVISEVDLDFDLNVADPQSGERDEITGLEDFDLQQAMSQTQERIHEPILAMSQDENFIFSTTEQFQSEPQKKRKYFRLVVDDTDRMLDEEVLNMRDQYNNNMAAIDEKLKTARADQYAYSKVIEELECHNIPFINYAHQTVFDKRFSMSSKLPSYIRNTKMSDESMVAMNSIVNEIKRMSRLPLDADYEVGRDTQATVLQDALHSDEIDLHDIDLAAIPSEHPQSDIFDLSLRELNEELSHTNRGDNISPQITTTYPELASSNNQIARFFEFVTQRQEAMGTRFESDEMHLTGINAPSSAQNSATQWYIKMKFSELIPNQRNARDKGESPVTRNLAANSFSSTLTLATKNIVKLSSSETRDGHRLLTGEELDIIIPAMRR